MSTTANTVTKASDTPRTDAAIAYRITTVHPHVEYIPVAFARELERENAKLRTDLESTRRDLEYAAAKLEKAGLLND